MKYSRFMGNRAEDGRYRVVVDPLLCEGYAICILAGADVMDLDEWGYPVVLEKELIGAHLNAARRAVKACPTGALKLVEITS